MIDFSFKEKWTYVAHQQGDVSFITVTHLWGATIAKLVDVMKHRQQIQYNFD